MEKEENTIRIITYVFSFLNFIAKIILSVSLWIQFYKAYQMRKSKYNSFSPKYASTNVEIGLKYQK
jgi:hypothetical protein